LNPEPPPCKGDTSACCTSRDPYQAGLTCAFHVGEALATALTRAADTDRDAGFQRFHDALAENFSREEILEIVGIVVNMNVWTRIKLAEGAMPGPA
jgi:hypothetical protein